MFFELYGRRLLQRRFITSDPVLAAVIDLPQAGFRPRSGDVGPDKTGDEASVVRTVVLFLTTLSQCLCILELRGEARDGKGKQGIGAVYS